MVNKRDPLLLGVTATLDRGDGVGLNNVFQEIVFTLDLLPMIEAGYLSDIRAKQIRLAADFNQLHTRAGDFIPAETGRVFLNANGPEQVAAAIQEHAPQRKTLVFTADVAGAYAVADAVADTGLPAAAVDGLTHPRERRRLLRAFRNGDVQVLANCGIATEGYDEPSVNCVVIARPTKSRALYTQMIGRGTRRHPGKDDCLVLDVVGATRRHDLQTTATLFGLPTAALTSASVGEIVAARREQAAAERVQGELVAQTVELFHRRPVHWVEGLDGCFVLSTGQGSLILRPVGEIWTVEHRPIGAKATVLIDGLSLNFAQGYAEDYARTLGAATPLLVRDAAWRFLEPTEKQRQALRRLRIPIAGIYTRGEASDAISRATARLGAA